MRVYSYLGPVPQSFFTGGPVGTYKPSPTLALGENAAGCEEVIVNWITFRRRFRRWFGGYIECTKEDEGKLKRAPWMRDFIPLGNRLKMFPDERNKGIDFRAIDASFLSAKGRELSTRPYVVDKEGRVLARTRRWETVLHTLWRLKNHHSTHYHRAKYLVHVTGIKGEVSLIFIKFPPDVGSWVEYGEKLIAEAEEKKLAEALAAAKSAEDEVSRGFVKADEALAA